MGPSPFPARTGPLSAIARAAPTPVAINDALTFFMMNCSFTRPAKQAKTTLEAVRTACDSMCVRQLALPDCDFSMPLKQKPQRRANDRSTIWSRLQTRRLTELAMLEVGLALFHECLHAFLLVFGGKQCVKIATLEEQRLGQRRFEGAVDAFLGHHDRGQ